MKIGTLSMAILTSVMLAACSSESDPRPDENLGVLQLALSGVDSAQVSYRLRNATFRITSSGFGFGGSGGGAANAYDETISSDAEPVQPVIVRRLLPGDYSVQLVNRDWYLERERASGPERVEEAVLLSEPSQYVYIYDQGVTPLQFQFGVDGELIDFRHGELRICISIEHPDEQRASFGGGVPFAGVGGFVPTDPCFGSQAGTGGRPAGGSAGAGGAPQ